MKRFCINIIKIFLLISISIFFFEEKSIAQNPVPNPGFETWIEVNGLYEEPEGWGSQNPYTWSFVFTVSKDQSSFSGDYAVKIATKGHNNTFITGILCSGVLNVSDFSCKGGFPVDYRWGYFSGYFKYAHDSADVCMMKALMWKWNTSTLSRDTVATAVFYGDNISGEYEPFGVPFEYKSADVPDSAMIVIAATDSLFSAPIGSVLLVDDIAFSGSIGINEVSSKTILIYPNPADEKLFIQLPQLASSTSIKIYDLAGRLISSQSITAQQIKINTKEFPDGLYYFMVESIEGKNISAGKFVVQHNQ
jgi:hypothetical protein